MVHGGYKVFFQSQKKLLEHGSKIKHFGAMKTYSADSDEVLGGATTLTSSWIVNSKIMRSTIPSNMFVPHDNTTLAYKLLVKQHLDFIEHGRAGEVCGRMDEEFASRRTRPYFPIFCACSTKIL